MTISYRWHRFLKSFFIIISVILLVFAIPPQRSEISLSEDFAQKASIGEVPADLLSALPLQFIRNPEPGEQAHLYPWAQVGGGLLLGPGSLLFRMAVPSGVSAEPGILKTEQETQALDLPVEWVGSWSQPRMDGSNLLPGKVNLFQGSDPQGWHSNLPAYGGVRYEDLYPGIHLLVQGSGGQLESIYRVEKNADPSLIRWRYPQGFDLQVDEATGDLLVSQSGRLLLTEKAPQAWQTPGQQRTSVEVGFQVRSNEVSFEIGSYNPDHELVIDPVVVLSSYIGEGTYGAARKITTDANGSIYIAGDLTQQYNTRMFVAKINPDTWSYVFTSIIGIGNGDIHGISIDPSGTVYITGVIAGGDFPLVNPLQTSCPYVTSFITKIKPDGSGLLFSSYLCGSVREEGYDITVDGSEKAYLIGTTESTDFPVTPGAFDTTQSGETDMYLAIVDTLQPALLMATYLGGNRYDVGFDIELDNQGYIYILGRSNSDNYPTLNAISSTNPGGMCSGYACYDAVLTKLDPTGSALIYSTYLGGTGTDYGMYMDIDSSGAVYLIGTTTSEDFPLVNPIQTYNFANNADDIFIMKINPAGNTILFSTYLAGPDTDRPAGIKLLTNAGAFAVAGDYWACLPLFSYRPVPYSKGFYLQFNTSGIPTDYLTFGSNINFYLNGLAMDDQDNAYLVGQPGSTDFQLIDPFSTTPSNAFLMKIAQTRPIKPGSYLAYLPMTTNKVTGIYGWVTFHNCGVLGISLELRYFNGTTWSTRATTTTAADGKYIFSGVPALNPGERYYVRYINTTISNRLWMWGTRVLTAYQANTDVFLDNFEIVNLSYRDPIDGSHVRLPYEFSWFNRYPNLQDSYDLNFFELDGNDAWYTPPLGYVYSYTLNSIPAGFEPTHPVAWYIGIHSPRGGYGEAFETYLVYFTNSGLPATAAQQMPESSLLKRLDQLERKKLQELEAIH